MCVSVCSMYAVYVCVYLYTSVSDSCMCVCMSDAYNWLQVACPSACICVLWLGGE